MNEVKKCPKCSGEMVEGSVKTCSGLFRLQKRGDFGGTTFEPSTVRNGGYIEFYKQMKEGVKI
jgi:predicted nucleic-acid-binding Zn-ribbon protein